MCVCSLSQFPLLHKKIKKMFQYEFICLVYRPTVASFSIHVYIHRLAKIFLTGIPYLWLFKSSPRYRLFGYILQCIWNNFYYLLNCPLFSSLIKRSIKCQKIVNSSQTWHLQMSCHVRAGTFSFTNDLTDYSLSKYLMKTNE